MTLRQNIKYWLYSSCPGYAGSFPYFGTTVYFPPKSEVFRRLCHEGIYEGSNVALLRSLVRPNTVILDIGANLGFTSIPLLAVNELIEIWAFEPSPNVRDYLGKTIAASKYKDRWIPIPKAVSSSVGTARFACSDPTQSIYDGLEATGRSAMSDWAEVPTTTVDFEWKSRGCPRVSIIKCDIEGGESEMFKGARACLEQNRPALLIEWQPLNLAAYKVDPSDLIRIAQELNYELFAMPHLVPIANAVELRVHTLENETFLLMPR